MSYLPKEYKKERNLTEKQQLFLDKIIETKGDLSKASELAGYSGNYHQVLKSLREEVIDLASDVLARSAPQAAFKLLDVLNSDKPIPQASNKLQVDHNVSGGIFILPEKDTIEAEVVDHEDILDRN